VLAIVTKTATPAPATSLVVADVDGTLVTPGKELTDRTIAAVRQLAEAGIRFTVASGRPPRGMAMLVRPLELALPIAAFNGGLFVHPDMSVIEERAIPAEAVGPTLQLMSARRLEVWLYRGSEWLVRDTSTPHVAKESATVRFRPTHVEDFDGVAEGVVKIVGVSDDLPGVAEAEAAARSELGDQISAVRSQPYNLDVTHPAANKGRVVDSLARLYGLASDQIATIGDMPSDVLMFVRSGLSIAMGNASPGVQRAARRVTASNAEDGFALAIEQLVLGEISRTNLTSA
jgi:Cof subfamily protein (haloacid dehalogenase superfamily)